MSERLSVEFASTRAFDERDAPSPLGDRLMSESKAPIDRRGFLRGCVAAVAAGEFAVLEAARSEDAGVLAATSPQQEADAFLVRFVDGWLPLQTAAEEANWAASTDVSAAHTATQIAKNLELNRYVG